MTPYQQEQASNYDWNEFEEGVLEQEAKHQTDQKTDNNKATTKVVTHEDGTKEVVTVDEKGQVVTKMKKIIIQQSATPVEDN